MIYSHARLATAPRDEATVTLRPSVTVVVPTLNEQASIGAVLEGVREALAGLPWRAIVVDDSEDATSEVVKLRARYDARITCQRRLSRRGLSGAVIDGALAASTDLVAVIDGDGQHDPAILRRLYEGLDAAGADLAVATRFASGGEAREGFGALRLALSRLAARASTAVLRVPLTDPMSGCFVIRRELIERVALRVAPQGYKVLFDVVACQPTPLRVVEAPLAFRPRLAGCSKFGMRPMAEHVALLAAHGLRGAASARSVLFATVGFSGLLVHAAVLGSLLRFGFAAAETIATLAAMTSNFLLNNAVTYRDRRLAGWPLALGWLRFGACCAVGAAAGVCTAVFVQERLHLWWVAGAAGAGVGAAWNYLATARLVW